MKKATRNVETAQIVANSDFAELMETKPTFNDLLDYLVDIASYRNEIEDPEALENLVKREIKRQARFIR